MGQAVIPQRMGAHEITLTFDTSEASAWDTLSCLPRSGEWQSMIASASRGNPEALRTRSYSSTKEAWRGDG